MEESGVQSPTGKNLFWSPKGLVPTQPAFYSTLMRGSLPEDKVSGRDVDHSPTSSAQNMNWRRHASTSPHAYTACRARTLSSTFTKTREAQGSPKGIGQLEYRDEPLNRL